MSKLRSALEALLSACVFLASVGIYDLLKVTDEELGVANTMWDLFSVVGLGLAIIFFLLDFQKTLIFAGSNFQLINMITPFIKFAGTAFILSKGKEIVGMILGMGNKIIDSIEYSELDLENKEFTNMFDDANIFVLVLALILCLVMLLVSLIIGALMMFKCIAYKIELIIRVGLTPLSLGDLGDGWQSKAFKWLKGIFGHMLYGACFILVIQIGTQLQPAISTSIMGAYNGLGDIVSNEIIKTLLFAIIGLLSAILVPIAELGVLGACKQLTQEVMQ